VPRGRNLSIVGKAAAHRLSFIAVSEPGSVRRSIIEQVKVGNLRIAGGVFQTLGRHCPSGCRDAGQVCLLGILSFSAHREADALT
jgi:hypothetical protein